MPETLKVDLQCETFMPVLRTHPILYSCLRVEEHSFVKICHLAMKEQTVATQQHLFQPDQSALTMHFLVSGLMDFRKMLTTLN